MTQQRKRAGLTEMADLAGSEARRIRIVQAGLVREGMLKQPHADQIRRAEVFEDIELFFLAVQPVREQVVEIVGPVLKAMRTAETFKDSGPRPTAADREPANHEND